MPTKRHWCSWSRYRSTTTYADCLSGFFHAQQLQRQWSAFFLKSGLLVRPHRARMTDSLLEMLVFLKYNSCLIWDIGLMSTHNNWNKCVLFSDIFTPPNTPNTLHLWEHTPHLQLHRVTAKWGYTWKPFCRKETAQCQTILFGLMFANQTNLAKQKRLCLKVDLDSECGSN